MYNEERSFSVRNVIIQFLFLALFVFILIWLFPMKKDVNNLTLNEGDDIANTVLLNRIFNENAVAMKDAAKAYFTTERLPEEVGDTVRITLGEMLEKKIILPFCDKNGDECNLEESYVEIEKLENEFVMKINLKCGEEENYYLVYMGCYDYCQTALCEKNKEDINNLTPTDKQEGKVEYVTIYKYERKELGHTVESDWSEWSTTPVEANDTTAVKTKTVAETSLVSYNVTTEYDKSKPITSIVTKNIGTKEITSCTAFDYVKDGEVESFWEDKGLVTLYSVPTNTATKHYEFVRFTDESCGLNCTSSLGIVYRVYEYTTLETSTYQCVSRSTKVIPLTVQVESIIGYETNTIKTPVYDTKNVTYYSFRTKEYIIDQKADTAWSYSKNDKDLLAKNFEYANITSVVEKKVTK